MDRQNEGQSVLIGTSFVWKLEKMARLQCVDKNNKKSVRIAGLLVDT